MSLPVRERLAELSADVDQVRLAPATTVRARGLRRARRRRAGTALAATALVAAAGFGLTNVLGSAGPDPVATLPAGPLPAGTCGYPVDLAIPDAPESVEIQVFAGSGPRANAGQVVRDLDARGFTASDVPGGDPAAEATGTVAVLRYGPGAIGTATLVRALVGGDAVAKFDPGRGGRTVDVVLGPAFHGLATTAELNQNLVRAGEPTAPPECR